MSAEEVMIFLAIVGLIAFGFLVGWAAYKDKHKKSIYDLIDARHRANFMREYYEGLCDALAEDEEAKK